jgi:hypothetical protein
MYLYIYVKIFLSPYNIYMYILYIYKCVIGFITGIFLIQSIVGLVESPKSTGHDVRKKSIRTWNPSNMS